MRILVYMKDGRTVYLLERRSHLAMLVGREPWDDKHAAVHVHAGYHVRRDDPPSRRRWWPVAIRYINKASISVVEEAQFSTDPQVGP